MEERQRRIEQRLGVTALGGSHNEETSQYTPGELIGLPGTGIGNN